MSTYSKADTHSQWFQDDYPGAPLRLTPATMVVVLHTTEGTGWPGYNDGATAPNATHLPSTTGGAGAWRAHFPDERSSRALRNLSGGVETNTLNAFQIELIGTCDPKHSRSWNGQGRLLAGRDYVYWPNATEKQLRSVALMLADLHRRHGLQLKSPKHFIAYPGSYGASKVRMTFAEWRNAVGVVGHQHVPENSHGDPGDLNVTRILELARAMVRSTSEPKSTLLHLMHASMQAQDNRDQKLHDVRRIFQRASSRDVAWITGTEAVGDRLYLAKTLQDVARRHGYEFARPAGTDCWIAVNQDLIKPGTWEVDWIKVVDGGRQHRDTGVLGVRFQNDDLGPITVSAGHQLTRRQPHAAAKNRKVNRALGEYAKLHGKGAGLFFYGGDQNENDRRFDTFDRQPLTSAQDELGRWPSTGYGPIDVIASLDWDTRVKAKYVRALNDKVFKLYTDHNLVEAGYTVRHLR